jgi:hypothetical protein
MNVAETKLARPKPKRRLLRYSVWALLVIFCSSVLAAFWTAVVSPARAAARSAVCVNHLHNFSHACWGDVVWLSQDNTVARVSSCPICCQMGHPLLWDQPMRFVDIKGLPVHESEVPPKTVEEAKLRVVENKQKLKRQFGDAANNPQPQSESPPGSAGPGKTAE